jgi:hypothetical protein
VGAAERFGAPAQIRSLEFFHSLISPPGNATMAVVTKEMRVYVDDSGDEPDPQHTVVALAAYMAELDQWKKFEGEWSEVLGDNQVPYLHMKEWWDEKKPIYQHLKASPAKAASFFGDLAGVIKRHINFCATATVRLADLRRFNAESNSQIEAYPLGLYGCIIELRQQVRHKDISIVIDRISKPHRAIDLAETYAKTDSYEDLKMGAISIVPLKETESFKTVLPIQASDFMAWELRKASAERVTWQIKEEDVKTQGDLYHAHKAWRKKRTEEIGKEPYDNRKSAWALYRACEQKGALWDYDLITAADKIRHKNGWL